MSSAKKVARNTSFIVAGEIVVKLVTLAITIYLAKYLGVADFGKYVFIITFLMFFGVISGFGLDQVVIRDIARNMAKTNEIINNALFIRIITSFVAITLAIITIRILNYPDDVVFFVTVTSIILLFQGISYLIESLFQSNLKMEFSAIAIIISKIVFALLVFLLIWNKGSLLHILFAFIFSESLRMIIGIGFSNRFTVINRRINSDTCKYLLKEAMPFIAAYALFIIYYRIDIVMLSYLKGDIAVGYYSAAYKLTDPLIFLPGALASTLMPVMSRQYALQKEKVKTTYLLGSKYILALMLPITIGVFLLSGRIIDLLYGQDFVKSTIALQILSLTIIFNSLNSIQSSLLMSTNRQKFNTIAIGVCCILNIALNILLIPQYSYMGAASATLICVIVLFLIEFAFVYSNMNFHLISRESAKAIVSAFAMGGMLQYFSNFDMVYIIVAGILSYMLIMFALKGFSRQDVELIKRVLK